MNKVFILQADHEQYQINLCCSHLADRLHANFIENFHHWNQLGTIHTWSFGEAACEEVFDLLNNPANEHMKMLITGDARPFNVGDVVEIVTYEIDDFPDYETYICLDRGWKKIQ